MRPDQMVQTQLLLDVAVECCTYLGMRLKYVFGDFRPSELSPEVQPLLPTPGHATYPMGHAEQNYAVAAMLAFIARDLHHANDSLNALVDEAFRLAHRISVNRVIAGTHFPVDVHGGALLGITVAQTVWSMAIKCLPATNASFPALPPVGEYPDGAGLFSFVNAAGVEMHDGKAVEDTEDLVSLHAVGTLVQREWSRVEAPGEI